MTRSCVTIYKFLLPLLYWLTDGEMYFYIGKQCILCVLMDR